MTVRPRRAPQVLREAGALLLVLGSLWPLAATAATYFVATDGRDQDPGTIEKPFATILRAQEAAAPGDTVSVRGGTYAIQEAQIAQRKGIFAYTILLDKSGAPEKRINYWAYRDEKPVFDFSAVKPAELRVHAFSVRSSWVHLRGLEVIGVQVTIKGHTQSVCFENNGSHNIYERLSMHDGQAIGLYSVRGSGNLFLNCDAYNNHDFTSEDGKGGNVDGFGCHPTKGSTGNVFRGCRAWFNSDDGFDCINSFETVTFESCWAFNNGLSAKGEKLGDGNGFKVGGYGTSPVERLPNPIPRHVVRGCVAVGNRANGFYANHHLVGSDWFNNTAYRNGANFSMLGRLADNRTDVPGSGHCLRNNVSYNSRALITKFDPAKNKADHNSFAPDLKLTDRDFVCLDEAQLTLPRQADGSLPEITFLHLAEGSVLVDRGVEVGLPFRGLQPDLGAFER
jgi:hypothetical protein